MTDNSIKFDAGSEKLVIELTTTELLEQMQLLQELDEQQSAALNTYLVSSSASGSITLFNAGYDVSSEIKLETESTDLWISGNGNWNNVKINAGEGDHNILVDNLDANKAALTLKDGNTTVILGTPDAYSNISVKGSDGNYRLKANAVDRIELRDGDHIINVGEVGHIKTGAGNSVISFIDGGDDEGASIETGAGSHTIMGMGLGAEADTEIDLNGSNGSSNVALSGAYGKVKVEGSGNHQIHIASAAKAEISLEDEDGATMEGTNLSIDSLGSKGAKVSLGKGNHQIALGTEADDEKTEIKLGDGDHNISVNGASRIELGKGDHFINAGKVEKITTSDGEQVIFFVDGIGSDDTRIETKGKGGDIVIGQNLGNRADAEIKTDKGDDTIILLNGNWNGGKIEGGKGHDVLYLDDRIDQDDLDIKDVEEIVLISHDGDVSETLAFIGLEIGGPDMSAGGEAGPGTEFDLVPTPDPVAGTAVQLMFDNEPFEITGEDDREERLMEPMTLFFERAISYEETFAQEFAETYYAEAEINAFGDLTGTNGEDEIEDNDDSHWIYAMGGDDVVEAKGGNDLVYGGDGNDVLDGGDGNDILDGAAGYDVLIGGDGIDVFVFRQGDGTTDIADFEMSHDILDVEGFTGLTYEALSDAGRQVGDDVYYELGTDLLILRDADLFSMQEIDLCIK